MRGKALVALGVAVTCGVAAPAWVAAKVTDYVASIDVRPAEPGQDVSQMVGYVFEDLDRDGRHQGDSERGHDPLIRHQGAPLASAVDLGYL